MYFKFRQLSDRVFTAIILALIAVLLAYNGLLVRFDNLHYDLGRYLTFKPAPADIVIVAIDEASLQSIGRWPWSRIVHADLVNKLKQEQARVIGLDIIFAEPELSNAEADLVLANAIKQAGNVVLPLLFEEPYIGSPIKQSVPIASFAEHAAALGRVHVPLDADGIARSIYLWEGLGAARLPHFSQAVLQAAKELPNSIHLFPASTSSESSTTLVSLDERKVKFLGPPGHFQRISYINVLTGEYPLHFFKDKIVLVGATAVGLGDVLPTPVSAHMQPMPGVEFHANAIAAMRNSELIVNAPFWLTCLLSIILAVIPLLFLPKLSPLKSLLSIVFYYFVVMGIAVAMPQFFNIWIPPAGALIAILLAYPVWSWRKLESAQIYLDNALQNLHADLALLGVNKEDLEYADDQDLMRSRISNVRLASKHLHDLHGERRDTLSFISHDLRAPLGAAIMLLNEGDNNKNLPRITNMLNKSLAMADNFLQSSRAEMANAAKFQDLDLVNLLQQALDDTYAAARAKKVTFNTIVPEDSLWLKGDFGLLQRAVTNILMNAVKYSPEGAVVTVSLTEKNNLAILIITDTGPGILPEKITKLFKRFSRLEGEQQASEGTGLGLYFVDVTVKKHGGSVTAANESGLGAVFTIILPLEI
ncbi:CHASE2 domain-containing protein [Methylotenera sp.]|uniref:CHASE2 domain-containing protein n=1 Tax=Methylotenera sp. TaxID=2051956 RepID=UPI00272F5F32|nr:CHASE2 domain-containing protein [Methylotenera sp.]MDP1521889.1 CHASE2 domain-containing protein [Methylotenera sp.]MDP3308258.1 CHASE2 domain-containing protein [Methylotenera sp.]